LKATKFGLPRRLFWAPPAWLPHKGTGSSGNSGGAEGRNDPDQSDARPALGEQCNTRTPAESGGTMQQSPTGMSTGTTKQDQNAGPNSPSSGATK
jgi:hypothetical protein